MSSNQPISNQNKKRMSDMDLNQLNTIVGKMAIEKKIISGTNSFPFIKSNSNPSTPNKVKFPTIPLQMNSPTISSENNENITLQRRSTKASKILGVNEMELLNSLNNTKKKSSKADKILGINTNEVLNSPTLSPRSLKADKILGRNEFDIPTMKKSSLKKQEKKEKERQKYEEKMKEKMMKEIKKGEEIMKKRQEKKNKEILKIDKKRASKIESDISKPVIKEEKQRTNSEGTGMFQDTETESVPNLSSIDSVKKRETSESSYKSQLSYSPTNTITKTVSETLSKILKSDDINQEVKKKINDSSSPPLGKVTELEDIDSLQPSEEDITSSQITDISEYSSDEEKSFSEDITNQLKEESSEKKTKIVYSLSFSEDQKKSIEEKNSQENKEQKKYEVHLICNVSIFGLDIINKSWVPIDGGSSTLRIFHDFHFETSYRIAAFSKFNEYIINEWLASTNALKQLSNQFFHIQFKVKENQKDYGIQFKNTEDGNNFLKFIEFYLNNKSNVPSSSPTMHRPTIRKAASTTNLRRSENFKSRSINLTTSMKSVQTPVLSEQSIESLKIIASSFEENTIDFIKMAHESILNPNSKQNLSTQEIWDSIQVVLFITKGENISELLSLMIEPINEILEEPIYGQPDEAVINAAIGLSTKHVKSNLIKRIFNESNGVSSLSVQISSLMVNIANYEEEIQNPKYKEKERETTYHQLILQFIIVVRSFMSAIQKLLDDIETLNHICTNIQSTNTSKDSEILEKEIGNDNLNIWNDPDIENFKPENGCTLNQLIYKLTTDINYDNTFLQTFITTYRSFSTPWNLFEKLKERYNVPLDKMDKKRATAIKMRVIIALKYWVETQFIDFEEDLIIKMQNFIDNTLKDDGHVEMANSLKRILQNKIEEKEKITKLMFTIPKYLKELQNFSLGPFEVFMNYPPSIIAQQLTLIDFEYYSRIEVTQLLNQSWNKPKLKHRSPDVLALIHRSTKLSFWVASTILYADRLLLRVKVVEKMIDIAMHLFQLNNFNTLMSLLAGLNLSVVHRLKETFKRVSSEKRKILSKLHAFMSPDSSYKNYRAILSNITPPYIPYLGVYLTDLTFMEEGNQDLINSKINWRKREMIFKTIRDVIQPQNTSYSFTKEQTLSVFLQELPYNHIEEEMYEISRILEPKSSRK